MLKRFEWIAHVLAILVPILAGMPGQSRDTSSYEIKRNSETANKVQ